MKDDPNAITPVGNPMNPNADPGHSGCVTPPWRAYTPEAAVLRGLCPSPECVASRSADARCPLEAEWISFNDVIASSRMHPQALMQLVVDGWLACHICAVCQEWWFIQPDLFAIWNWLERTNHYQLYPRKDIYCAWLFNQQEYEQSVA